MQPNSQQLLSIDPDEVSPYGKLLAWQCLSLNLGMTRLPQLCLKVSSIKPIDLQHTTAQAAHEGPCMDICTN